MKSPFKGASGAALAVLVLMAVVMLTSCPPPFDERLVHYAEDRISPFLHITSPVNYDYYRTTVVVQGTVNDSSQKEGDLLGGVSNFSFAIVTEPTKKYDFSVEFDPDRQSYEITETSDEITDFEYDFLSGSFVFSFSTLDINRGDHFLSFTVVDWAGLETFQTLTIREERYGPEIGDISIDPSNDSVLYYSQSVSRDFTVSGTVGSTFLTGRYTVEKANGQLDRSDFYSPGPLNDTAPRPFSFSFSTQSPAPSLSGNYSFYIFATNSSDTTYKVYQVFEDSTPPSLAKLVSISSDNPANDRYASAGSTVTLEFHSDDILDAREFDISIQGTPVPEEDIEFVSEYDEGGSTYYVWRASLTLVSGTDNQPVPFLIAAYVDKAGNPGPGPVTSTTDGSSVTYDDSIPNLHEISLVSGNAWNSDRAAVGDGVTVEFRHNSVLNLAPPYAPVITIAGRAATFGTMNSWTGSEFVSETYVTMLASDSDPSFLTAPGIPFSISNVFNNLGRPSPASSYTASTDSTIVVFDPTAPPAPSDLVLSVIGTPAVSGYWNSFTTGISGTVSIPPDASLLHFDGGENGALQLQISVNGSAYADIGSPQEITAVGTSMAVAVGAADLPPGLDDGDVLTFRPVLYDTAGNSTAGTASPNTFTYDVNAPSISISSPAAGTRTNGSSALVFGYTAPDTATAPEARFNSGSWVGVASGTPLSGIAGFSTLPEGVFTVTVRDTDSAGNTGTSSGVSLVKDTVRPAASATYNRSSRYYRAGDSITITADFTESMDAGYTLSITFEGAVNGTYPMSRTSATRYTYTSAALLTAAPSGSVTIMLSGGRDLAGNLVQSAPTIGGSFTIDNDPPTAAVEYRNTAGDPIDSPFRQGDVIVLWAVFSEDMNQSIRPIIDIDAPGSGNVTNVQMTWQSAARATYQYTVGSGDGEAVVTIDTAQDPAGNAVTGAPTSGGTFTVDNTAPAVVITAPAGGDVTGAEDLVFTDDGANPEASFDDVNWTSVTSPVRIDTIAGWAGIAEDANFTLYVRDVDQAGNEGKDSVGLTKNAVP